MRRIAAWCLAVAFFLPITSYAQQRTEYRALWVDTLSTRLETHANVLAVVANAKAINANVIFAQIRRRGDAWYRRGDAGFVEPTPDQFPFAANFDPLQDLIDAAHAEGIEVHAYVIIGAIWHRAPNLFPPASAAHVFNQHGGFNAATNTIVHTSNTWLTRTVLTATQQTAAGITYQGHRFGADFWLDLGHPDAAEYTHNVVMSLVRNYDIDGVHLDRIRYPEFSGTGITQTPSSGTSIGYNSTSVARYRQRFGGVGDPPQNEANWVQWRRNQVTNFVRRLYVEVAAVKPQIKMSAALIAFGGGPTTEASWSSAEAYWRVYQDWRWWTEEGILDIAIPMVYKREHTAGEVTQFNQWLEWLKNHQYNRSGAIGIGNYLNSVEGTIRQTRRALLSPSTTGNFAAGVSYFSMATPDAAAAANPFSVPPGQNTPVRGYAEFAAGLTTSKSVNGATLYEPIPNDGGVLQQPAAIPLMTWRTAPTRGHVKGFARRADNTILDTSAVTITDALTNETKTSQSDGKGFYGGVDLKPGIHSARAVLGTETLYSCYFNVAPGKVSTADINSTTPTQFVKPLAAFEAEAEAGSCSAHVATGTLSITDACSGARTIDVARSDNASLTSPFPVGTTTITWTVTDSIGSSTFVQTVTVKDTQSPVIAAPADITTSTDPGSCTATVAVGSPVASDNCSFTLTKSRSDGAAIDAPYPKGLTTITWTATDAGGRSASATQKIVVADTEPPSVQAPADIEVNAPTGSCEANVNAGTATASDNCGPVTVTASRSDGKSLSAAYPKGTTTITWTATDSAGLTSAATQTITVKDAEAPVITHLRTDRRELWPPIHQMVTIRVSYDVSDNCGTVTTSLSVTSNEPENGLGDGDTAPDFTVVNNHEVELRAERSPFSDGRVYTVTVTAVDASGNTSTQSIDVTVPLNQGNN
jgi:uncharacterized lipoprotein YddW (UPF0748 family)